LGGQPETGRARPELADGLRSFPTPTPYMILFLRSHIEAMGGMLEIVAHFPDGSVKINNFESLDDNKKATV